MRFREARGFFIALSYTRQRVIEKSMADDVIARMMPVDAMAMEARSDAHDRVRQQKMSRGQGRICDRLLFFSGIYRANDCERAGRN
jgi:hypothetical protein